MNGRVTGCSPIRSAFYIEPGDTDPTICRHMFYLSCVGNSLRFCQEIVKYVCINCGEYQKEPGWPCVDTFGEIEDRAAGIPIGEM